MTEMKSGIFKGQRVDKRNGRNDENSAHNDLKSLGQGSGMAKEAKMKGYD